MLASCAPVNNITKDKNHKTDKTDNVVSTEILVESSTDQENEKLEEKKQMEFSEKIDELNQETDTLLEEIDKWQM